MEEKLGVDENHVIVDRSDWEIVMQNNDYGEFKTTDLEMNPAFESAVAPPMDDNNFANFMAASSPGGIEAQERMGQKDVCRKTMIPKEMIPNRRAYEDMGIHIRNDANDIFFSADYPKDWTIKPTNNPYYSLIIDNTGKERAQIFYKAAFYDKSAYIRLTI